MRHAILGFLGSIPVIVAASTIGLLAQGTDGKVQPWDNATWKVNVAKSKYDPPELAPKSFIVKREPFEGGFKVTGDQVDGWGKAIHTIFAGKYDGRDYPNQGTQPPTAQAYR